MLNMKKAELEPTSDARIYLFFDKVVRGGVSYISKRYSKVSRCYDPKQESKHIIYVKASNVYDYVMSKFLPTSGLKWIDPKEFDLNK